jgi:glycolate oxidase iron-sulfur subunit
MQTAFTLAQLADPDVAESEKILRACVHCGFCTATCPTYVLLGDELDSPRGRIYLIKDMLEHDAPASADVVKHIDRCLSCLACMSTCPSGVHYMHLVDHARVHIERTYRRPLLDRVMRAALAWTLPDNRRFRAALMLARLVRPLAPMLAVLGLKPFAAMLRLAPSAGPASPTPAVRRVVPAHGHRRARVALMTGCVTPVIGPQINEAAIRVLTRHGVEVVLAEGQGCCGGIVHHMGREHDALAAVRRNIDAWLRELDGEGLDAVISTASGCGTTLKDYGFMLRSDTAYARKAARISALARDVCEFLPGLELSPRGDPAPLVVAYHAACSLQHGQKITRQPKELLSKIGFVVKDVPEAHLCCGSAGTYNILQSEIADRLRARKVGNIERVKPDVIAAGNVGCITQIAVGTTIPVVHPVELIDWATGGPIPETLKERSISAAAGRASEAALQRGTESA